MSTLPPIASKDGRRTHRSPIPIPTPATGPRSSVPSLSDECQLDIRTPSTVLVPVRTDISDSPDSPDSPVLSVLSVRAVSTLILDADAALAALTALVFRARPAPVSCGARNGSSYGGGSCSCSCSRPRSPPPPRSRSLSLARDGSAAELPVCCGGGTLPTLAVVDVPVACVPTEPGRIPYALSNADGEVDHSVFVGLAARFGTESTRVAEDGTESWGACRA